MGQTPALVILAAGASERLGTCKALVELGGRTVLERLLDAGSVLDATPALVIAGRHLDEIRGALPDAVELADNPDWAKGRTGSVQVAARERAGFDLCLAPVDVPLVPREVFQSLATAWAEAGAPARGWLAPKIIGLHNSVNIARYGHPVILGRELVAQLCEFQPNQPLTELRAAALPLLSVAVNALEVLDDLDDSKDLALLRGRLREL